MKNPISFFFLSHRLLARKSPTHRSLCNGKAHLCLCSSVITQKRSTRERFHFEILFMLFMILRHCQQYVVEINDALCGMFQSFFSMFTNKGVYVEDLVFEGHLAVLSRIFELIRLGVIFFFTFLYISLSPCYHSLQKTI